MGAARAGVIAAFTYRLDDNEVLHDQNVEGIVEVIQCSIDVISRHSDPGDSTLDVTGDKHLAVWLHNDPSSWTRVLRQNYGSFSRNHHPTLECLRFP